MYRQITAKTSMGDYPIFVGRQMNYGQMLLPYHKPCHVLLVSDDTVFGLYGEKTVHELSEAGYLVDTFVFAHGETSKNLNVAGEILEYAGSLELTRSDLFVALGGGVVGDMTGFCSSVFLRGTQFVQIPTTLLAAVDSSVGGKTAVDLSCGKNLAGAFHQPIAVLLDVDTFDTLPKSIFAEGMAEAIKYGLISDGNLFKMFESGEFDIVDICERCIQIKADVVEVDEFDNGLRKILNFGHTPAHGIEKLSSYRTSHGNAVAIGMRMMTLVSEKKGLIPAGSCDRLEKILEREGLPMTCPYAAADVSKAAMNDKKRAGGTISVILLDEIGKARIEPVPVECLKDIFEMGYSK